LADTKPIFTFEFTQIKEALEDTEPSPIDRKKRISPLKKNKPLPEYRRQVKEALAQLNTSHMVEQAF